MFAAALAMAALHCVFASAAQASPTEASMMMDDDQLIYVSTQHADHTLVQMKSLGVDVVKVSLAWQLVAPNAYSRHRPNFNAGDPGAYPWWSWGRYDNIVEVAHELGMKVYFLLIGPAPKWAIPKNIVKGQGPATGYAPDTREYRQFVQAAGTRYSGDYVPAGWGPLHPLPRVDYWGIWNEPNERSWLNPSYRSLPDHRTALIQPELYRGLVDAAWNGLVASGHSGDNVMVGETANVGVLTPRQFVRGLYCVGASLLPLRGAAAEEIGCPTSGSPSAFVARHPGLFKSGGYAHHPYAFVAPDRPYPDHSFITLENLPAFEQMLNGIFATYGVRPSGGVPIYLTEWGYKTDPPNPFAHTSLAQQAAWLNEGEYMTWRDPFVRGITQFLLVDSPPIAGAERGSALYWSSFQTGLESTNGRPKPSFEAFRMPIWLPAPRHGPDVTIWGQLRAADHSAVQYAEIQFEARGSSNWSGVTWAGTDSPEGFLLAHVAIGAPGLVRLASFDQSGNVVTSRAVAIG